MHGEEDQNILDIRYRQERAKEEEVIEGDRN